MLSMAIAGSRSRRRWLSRGLCLARNRRRRWDSFTRRRARRPIDYVEEPCQDAHLVLDEPLALPLALDESLAAIAADDLDRALRSPRLAAVVLKPTLLGGLGPALELARRARRAGVAAIAS